MHKEQEHEKSTSLTRAVVELLAYCVNGPKEPVPNDTQPKGLVGRTVFVARHLRHGWRKAWAKDRQQSPQGRRPKKAFAMAAMAGPREPVPNDGSGKG